jgi:hypothetical protein
VKLPPDNEFTAALLLAERAMQAVLGDRQAWIDEAANTAAAPLPWPLQARGEGYPQLLRILAVTAVDSTLAAMREADSIVIVADPANADFQLVLRMVRRAVDAADAAMKTAFGGKRGTHRLSGKREFHNWLKARDVEAAVRAGGKRADALAGLTMSRAAAYRAMKRR